MAGGLHCVLKITEGLVSIFSDVLDSQTVLGDLLKALALHTSPR